MADVRKLAPFILKWEGGFIDDPDDLGGATNMGVTIGTYEAYCRKKGYSKPTVERLKNLTKEEWTEILKTMYWDRWKADEIKSQSVDVYKRQTLNSQISVPATAGYTQFAVRAYKSASDAAAWNDNYVAEKMCIRDRERGFLMLLGHPLL